MKMTPADYAKLEAAIRPVLVANPDMYEDYATNGFSDMYFNWLVVRLAKFDVCQFYHYLNDDHINTALAKICGNTGKGGNLSKALASKVPTSG